MNKRNKMPTQQDAKPAHGSEYEDACCIFLGTEVVRSLKSDTTRVFDYWFCPAEPTLIARYGPDGDYKSNIRFIGHDRQIHRAFELLLDSALVQDGDKRRVMRSYEYEMQERLESSIRSLKWADLETLLIITKELREAHAHYHR